MGSGSQYLCGFPDLTVEMRVARYRALTQYFRSNKIDFFSVEMRVARYRALTQSSIVSCNRLEASRNESGPL